LPGNRNDGDERGDRAELVPVFAERELFTDCAGKGRQFDLVIREMPGHGFAGEAREVTRKRHGGYVFRSHAEACLPLALGRLRSAIGAGMAQRFLIRHGDGLETPLQRLGGCIEADGLVIDVEMLDWAALLSLLRTYEGFEFELRIPFESDR
jgi:hypothetical protein